MSSRGAALKLPAWKVGDRSGIEVSNKQNFFPRSLVKIQYVGSPCDREVACWASDRHDPNFEFCVWRTVSYHSSHHPQEALLAEFSLYVHKGGLKPHSFYFDGEFRGIDEWMIS